MLQSFFEEIEDLKFALQQSARLNKEYETVLRRTCSQFGVPYPHPERLLNTSWLTWGSALGWTIVLQSYIQGGPINTCIFCMPFRYWFNRLWQNETFSSNCRCMWLKFWMQFFMQKMCFFVNYLNHIKPIKDDFRRHSKHTWNIFYLCTGKCEYNYEFMPLYYNI